jgi:hypothetical protein
VTVIEGSHAEVEALLARLEGGPGAEVFLHALQKHSTSFLLDLARGGVDLLCKSILPTGNNRARLKLWVPRSGTLVAFVYKDSQVPFSTDRFAYGAHIAKGSAQAVTADDAKLLLDYLDSGVHPDFRPASLKRAFPYTIPR